MTAEPRIQAEPPDDVDGRVPAGLAFVLFIAGAALGLGAAIWLGANQCIRIGGCG